METKKEQVVNFREAKERKEEEQAELTNEEEREIQELINEFEIYSKHEDYE